MNPEANFFNNVPALLKIRLNKICTSIYSMFLLGNIFYIYIFFRYYVEMFRYCVLLIPINELWAKTFQ